MPNLVTTTVPIGSGQKSALRQRSEQTDLPISHFIRQGIQAVLERYEVPKRMKAASKQLNIFETGKKADRSLPIRPNHRQTLPPALAEGEPDETLSTQQAADAIGCAESTIRTAARQGRLRASKNGRSWSVRMDDLRRWFQRGHVRAQPEERISTAFNMDPKRREQLRWLSAEAGRPIVDLVHEGLDIVLTPPTKIGKRS